VINTRNMMSTKIVRNIRNMKNNQIKNVENTRIVMDIRHVTNKQIKNVMNIMNA
jgi:hypothetical protein